MQRGVALSKDFASGSQTKKGHGRIEKRTILTSTLLNDYLGDWPGLAQVFRVGTVVWYAHGTRYTRHIRYGFTSLAPDQPGLNEYWNCYKRIGGLRADYITARCDSPGRCHALDGWGGGSNHGYPQ